MKQGQLEGCWFILPAYRGKWKAIDKYLAVLSFLYVTYQGEFERVVEMFKRGNRVYFGKTREAVQGGGKGALQAKKIPNCPYWALATLDNRAKSEILIQLLMHLNFERPDIDIIPPRRNEEYA